MIYILIVVLVCTVVLCYILHESVKKNTWYESGHHSYDLIKLNKILSDFSKFFSFNGENLPYGRANGFFKTYVTSDISVDYFGYEPVASVTLEEFKEYGVLLTSEGILLKKQNLDKEISQEILVEFNGIWKIRQYPLILKIFYYESPTITLNVNDYIVEKNRRLTNTAIKTALQELIDVGYTRDLMKEDGHLEEYKSLNDENPFQDFGNFNPETWLESKSKSNQQNGTGDLDDQVEESVKKGHLKDGFKTSIKAANSLRLAMSSRSSNLVSQVRNTTGGAGFGAEIFNNVEDKLRFRQAEVIGGNNAKNGADRMVNGVEIQTKYYQQARSTVNSAFNENGYRYISENGRPMQLEVPANQYVQATEIMRDKIITGKVPGVTDPNQANQLIRRGHATYEQALLMTKAFNATSITHDLKSGLIQSSSPAGISVLIVFAHAKWSGATTEEAFKLAAKMGIVHVAIGTIMHASTAQLTKAALNSLLNTVLGGRLNKTIINGVPVVVTSVVLYGWETIEFSTGRISKNQFKKNVLIKTAGVGGAMVGATLPFFGPTVGAIGLGTVTYIGAQKVMNHIYKDDREKHYPILKEEFIDLIYSVKLSEIEIEEIKQSIFIKKLHRHIKSIQKQLSSQLDIRRYARDEIIMTEMSKVINKREKITKDEISLVEDYFQEVLQGT